MKGLPEFRGTEVHQAIKGQRCIGLITVSNLSFPLLLFSVHVLFLRTSSHQTLQYSPLLGICISATLITPCSIYIHHNFCLIRSKRNVSKSKQTTCLWTLPLRASLSFIEKNSRRFVEARRRIRKEAGKGLEEII